jgi:quercetin 2,3-dioxygenase
MTFEFARRREDSPLPRRPEPFGYVPAGIVHAYRVDTDDTRVLGVCTGGFERFFATLGEPTQERHYPAPPFSLPPGERFAAAGAAARCS